MASTINKVTTPVGEFQWVFITGLGKENFNKDGYEYTVDLILEGDKAVNLKADIDDAFKEEFGGKAKAKSLGYKVQVDDDGEETGRTIFTFKTKTTKRDGTPRKIKVGDSKGKVMDLGDRKISNGSTGVVHGAMGTYVNGNNKGVSLFLNQVQLLKFIPYEEAAMEDLGEEGGYEEPEMAEMEEEDY